MQKLETVTNKNNFYGNTNPHNLIRDFGSPLYVYNETILRQKCRDMKNLVEYPFFSINYSAKANSNLELLKIIRDEGLDVDAMSPGEIFIQLKAGFKPEQIFYIGNNVSAEEMRFAINRGVKVSVDSISQLETFGQINPGGSVAVRFNPGVGVGHHQKVVTGGKQTKFGVDPIYIKEIKNVLHKYNLNLICINQHIGSLFMEGTGYLKGVESLLDIAKNFDDLEFIDVGGGFGIPYRKQENEPSLDLKTLGAQLDDIFNSWVDKYGKKVTFKVEPGRYISAECGVLLGTVYAVKYNYDTKYIGTDLGFNVLARPVMYDSHHDVEVYREGNLYSGNEETVTIVGNICESGDIIANNRELPEIFEGDILGVLDAGAYGYAMSSNYNNRLRPAEVLIKPDGSHVLIRKRETLEDLVSGFVI